MNISQEMKMLVEFATQAMKDNAYSPDPHLFTCRQVADEYDLWEDDHFPVWLSFIVAGIGRDLGILN